MSLLAYENEERIYKLCECVIDLIEELQCYNKDLNNRLEWTKKELESLKKEIYA